jgi:hypothetical protein
MSIITTKYVISEFPYEMEFCYILTAILVHFVLVNYTLIYDEE